MPEPSPTQRVAAIICAHNAATYIASTVRSCRAIPGVDLIVVVDDGSDDDTGRNARSAGAVVVRHSVFRGRASALETGAKVAAMRDRADGPPRLLLVLSPDLGESVVEASLLVDSVMSGQADMAVAVKPVVDMASSADAAPSPTPTAGNRKPTWAERLARRAIRRATGWQSHAPLSAHRCMTRQLVTQVMPFRGDGAALDPAIAIDAITAGLSVMEVPCDFRHLSPADETLGMRMAATWETAMISLRMRLRQRTFAHQLAAEAGEQNLGRPYPRPAASREAQAASEAAAPTAPTVVSLNAAE